MRKGRDVVGSRGASLRIRGDCGLLRELTPPWRDLIPEPFRLALDPTESPDDQVVSLVALALEARRILLARSGLDRLGAVRWRTPCPPPPVDWLDQLSDRLSDRLTGAGVAPAPFDDSPLDETSDHLGHVYQAIATTRQRQRRGEFFTPDWLADRLVDELWTPGARWLDPTCGAGAFARALERKARREGRGDVDFVGMESNPWTALIAAATLAQLSRDTRPDEVFQPPIHWLDVVRGDLDRDAIGEFDRVIGNPPWITWDRLSDDYRAEIGDAWRRRRLFAETGMASILGGGKKDLSMLVTLIVADECLAPGGRLGFVVSRSLFSSRAARGLRRWTLAEGTPLKVERVDDVAALRPFRVATPASAVMCLSKGRPTTYPVPFHVWTDATTAERCAASPTDPADPLSSWKITRPGERDLLERVLGPCDYEPRLGVNTGGANGVYRLSLVEEDVDGMWRVTNRPESGKLLVESVETFLEPAFIYPALFGKDARAWVAKSSGWLLFVQDPVARRGWSEEDLASRAPRTLEYLHRFESILRARAAYRRFFIRTRRDGSRVETGPYYSMFDVGEYSLSDWKVVWNRMGSRLTAAAVGPVDNRPVLAQETHGLIAVETRDEADYLAALLNSGPAATAVRSIGASGGKSFATPRTIECLRLARFNPEIAVHAELTSLGERAQFETVARGAPSAATLARIESAAVRYWRLPDQGGSP